MVDQYQQDQEILNLVKKNQHESELNLKSKGLYDDWSVYYDMYRGVPDPKTYDWMSNKWIPLASSKINAGTNVLLNMLFAQDPNFEVVPQEPADDSQSGIIQKLLQYRLKNADSYYKMMNFIRNLLIYGTAFIKVYYDKREQKRQIKVMEMAPQFNWMGMMSGEEPTGNWVTENAIIDIFDGPNMEVLGIGDVFPDPASINVDDGWIIHRTYKSKDYLVNKYQTTQGEMYNEKVLLIEDKSSQEKNSGQNDILNSQQGMFVTRPKGTERVELLERHGLYDLGDGNGLQPCILTIANGKEVIRKKPNPYWHGKSGIVKGVYISLPNEFYGIGICETLWDLQYTYNDIFNQRIDNVSLSMNKPLRYRTDAGINIAKLIIGPGMIYGSQNDAEKDIVPIDIPDVTRNAYAECSEIERIAQEAVAITQLTIGMVGKNQPETASGQAMMLGSSQNILNTQAKIIENVAYKEILKLFYQIDYQFLDREKLIKIVGEKGNEFINVSPNDLVKDFDFLMRGTTTMENAMQKALKLIQLLNLLKGNPMVKENELVKDIATHLGVANPEKYIRTEEELMMMMAGQMSAQASGLVPPPGMEAGGPGQESSQFKGGEQARTPGMPPPPVSNPPESTI